MIIRSAIPELLHTNRHRKRGREEGKKEGTKKQKIKK
jgi:hypothetical protein